MTSSNDLEWKMVRIPKHLFDRLSKHGSYGDSMGDIIGNILKFYEEHHKDKGK